MGSFALAETDNMHHWIILMLKQLFLLNEVHVGKIRHGTCILLMGDMMVMKMVALEKDCSSIIYVDKQWLHGTWRCPPIKTDERKIRKNEISQEVFDSLSCVEKNKSWEKEGELW